MLQVQAAQSALARLAQVVLNEGDRDALLLVARRSPGLQEVASVVSKYCRLDQQNPWQYPSETTWRTSIR